MSRYKTSVEMNRAEATSYADSTMPPRLIASECALRPFGSDDSLEFARLLFESDLYWRWRHGAAVLSGEIAVRTSPSAIDFAVLSPTEELVGRLTVDRRSDWARTGFLSIAFAPEVRGTRVVAKALVRFLDLVFAVSPLEHLICEIPEYNVALLRSVVHRYCEPCGRLPDHIALGGAYWDLHLYRLDRQSYEAVREKMRLRSWLADSREGVSGDTSC